MRIEQAKELKVGQLVTCPADRGDPGYTGRVTHVSTNVCSHPSGGEYLWIEVQHLIGKRKTVWPSNRIWKR